MSNNEETGPSDQDADKMDYAGEQEYLDYLTAKQGLQVGLDNGTDADIDTDGATGKVSAGKIPAGKVLAPMPLPKTGSIRSRGYVNLTN